MPQRPCPVATAPSSKLFTGEHTMKQILGYVIYSSYTKKYLVSDYGSGGYCCEGESPIFQNGMAKGAWATYNEADKYARSWDGKDNYLKHAETYSPIPIFVEV